MYLRSPDILQLWQNRPELKFSHGRSERLDNANTFVPKDRTGFHAHEF